MVVKYIKLNDDAKEPYKKYDVDAGFDLTAISKKETEKYIEYGTGLAFEIPEGYVGLLFPRSSVTKEDLILKNCVGVVDASYRGEITFRFHGINAINYNMGEEKKIIYNENNYKVDDRVGQIVIIAIPKVKLIEAKELSETERGTAGYGSSGK